MIVHERECTHCGSIALWRDVDPLPTKCTSCGALPSRPRLSGPTVSVEVLYGFMCVRPERGSPLIYT